MVGVSTVMAQALIVSTNVSPRLRMKVTERGGAWMKTPFWSSSVTVTAS
jgi:hypothetical protein